MLRDNAEDWGNKKNLMGGFSDHGFLFFQRSSIYFASTNYPQLLFWNNYVICLPTKYLFLFGLDIMDCQLSPLWKILENYGPIRIYSI